MRTLKSLALVITLTSANAMAGDHLINVIGRGGWNYKDNDTTKTGLSNSSSMNIDYLRTTFSGIVTPSVKYLLTTDLLASSGSADSVDGASSFIDEAYLTKTFSFGTSALFGKKAVLIGGREYDYNDFDRYSVSSFKVATPSNQVGLTLTHDIFGQTLTAQYFNGNKNNGKGTSTNAQSKYGWAVGWYGNIGSDFIKPIIAYTVVPKTKNDDLLDANTVLGTSGAKRTNSGDDTYLSGGLQFNLPANFTVEADYNLLTEKNAEVASSVKKDVKLNSIVGLVRYATDRFAPFAKFISENRKSDSVKTAARTAYDVGIEFKEAKEDAIRYQVVYSGSTLKTSMDTTEVKSSPKSILVGLKFDAAILK